MHKLADIVTSLLLCKLYKESMECNSCLCNGFENIAFVLEKHVVEDDILFTNHPAGK